VNRQYRSLDEMESAVSGQSWGSLEKVTGQPPPGITRREWHELLDQLIELEAAGALDGIRAVVAERLALVRRPGPFDPGRDPAVAAREILRDPANWAGRLSLAAALLAAEIDRKDGA
jgi:hypothetical protein